MRASHTQPKVTTQKRSATGSYAKMKMMIRPIDLLSTYICRMSLRECSRGWEEGDGAAETEVGRLWCV